MTAAACAMATLVEARHDGRLAAGEIASVERHLASCAACSRLKADLELIRELGRRPLAGASSLDRRRGQKRLLGDAVVPRGAPRKRAVWLVAGATAIAAAALVVLARPSEKFEVLARLPHLPAIERTVTMVVPGDGTTFRRREAGLVETLTLEEGVLLLRVRHLGEGERFLVKTSDAEVEVRGTIFRVEAHRGEVSSVRVGEGRVEVRSTQGAFELEAGEAWSRASTGSTEPVPSGAVDEPAAVVVPAPPAAAKARPPSAPSLRSMRVSRAPEPPASGAPSDFEEGVRLTERGDFGAAAERLQAFREQHPSDEHSEDAMFLAAVALQRAGRLQEAEALSRSYLEQFPNGYHRAEAEAMIRRP